MKRYKCFQGLAMYGHEVLMSIQKRAKLFGTHFSSEVGVKSCCVFVRKPQSCRPTSRTTYNEFRLVDSCSVLMSIHFS
jgi:hypothetical protein